MLEQRSFRKRTIGRGDHYGLSKDALGRGDHYGLSKDALSEGRNAEFSVMKN